MTVRSVIAIAASKDWKLHQMDVFNAFLQGDLHEEVDMDLPQGFQKQGETKVCKLLKSLYGLKQALRQWNLKLIETLLNAGFHQNKRSGNDIFIILIYVDDLLITGSSNTMIDEAKKVMHQQFKVKDLGELRYFLGIEVLRSQQVILLNQRKYTLELISELGLSGAKPTITPLEINQKLTSVEYDKGVGMQVEDHMVDVTGYQKLIGKLLYLTITRPGISYVVQTLSQFMQAPKKSHMDEALRVVQYLKAAPDMGVLMYREPKDTLMGFCDSN